MNNQNTAISYLLLFLIPMHGAFYSFEKMMMGIFIALCLMSKESIKIPKGPITNCFGLIILGHSISIFFAVNKGYAIVGLIEWIVYFLAYVFINGYTKTKKEEILNFTAYYAVVLTIVTSAIYHINKADGIVSSNGRVSGFFEYENTWSLYLVLSALKIITKKTITKIDYVCMAVLSYGIFLTGSRSSLIILVIAIGYVIIKNFKLWRVTIAFGSLFVIGILANWIMDGLLLQRFIALQNSSSVMGRILYFKDAYAIILDNLFGIGKGGYMYVQPIYQTGIYTTEFVHNSFIQMFLDGGIISGFAYMTLAYLVIKTKSTNKMLAIVIFSHSLADFDIQYGVIVLLLILTLENVGNYYKGISKKALLSIVGVCSGLFVIYFSSFIGANNIAYKLYGVDIKISEKYLQTTGSYKEGIRVAEKIIEKTDLSIIAYDCVYGYSMENDDLESAVLAKLEYLKLNKYMDWVYFDMVNLLKGGEISQLVYNQAKDECLEILDDISNNTSVLAYKIYDKVDLWFVDEIKKQL